MRPLILLAALLPGCSPSPAQDLEGGSATADLPSTSCRFGESTDQWEEGIVGLSVEDGWASVEAGDELWDGALEQILLTLDYPGGPTTFDGALAETDDGQVLWKEIHDELSGDGYVVWAYLGGDNLHGAIFPTFEANVVARLADDEVHSCTVLASAPAPSCEDNDNVEADSAALLANTGAQVEVDAAFRVAVESFSSSDDTDWFRVEFATGDKRCLSCFHPHAWVEAADTPIGEVCTFVEAKESYQRGAIECGAGEVVEASGLVGCCSTNVSQGVFLNTEWDHEVGEGSTMYLRVTPAADVNSCSPYVFTYGHFAG